MAFMRFPTSAITHFFETDLRFILNHLSLIDLVIDQKIKPSIHLGTGDYNRGESLLYGLINRVLHLCAFLCSDYYLGII